MGKRLGVFLEALPLEQTRRFARLAEEQGLEQAWFPEITFGDAFVPVTVASLETSRLRLATGVVGIWSRTPAVMAMTAANLSQLCGGRLILGLGLQARAYVRNWHGADYRRPVRAMREYLSIVRAILSGERVSYEGEVFSIRNFQLQIPPPDPPVPLYMAAIGPHMIRLAGELADGLIGYFYSLDYLREVVLPNLGAGAERAGRSLDQFDLACGVPALLGRDDEEALRQHRGQILMFSTAAGSSPFYRESLARAGFAGEQEEISARLAAGDVQGALEAIPLEMVDACTVTGTPERAGRRIQEYFQAGVRTLVLNPSPPGVFFPLYEGHLPEGLQLPPFSFPDFLQSVEQVIRFAGGLESS